MAKTLFPLIFSLLIHSGIMLISFPIAPKNFSKLSKTKELLLVSKEKLQKIKNKLGFKEGSHNGAFLPVVKGKKPKKIKLEDLSAGVPTLMGGDRKYDKKDLTDKTTFGQSSIQIKRSFLKSNLGQKSDRGIIRITERKKILTEAFASAPVINLKNQYLINNTTFDMKIPAPKGVSEDQLNSEEMVYYGFRRRVLPQFYQSMILVLGKYEKLSPSLNLSSYIKPQVIKTQITYSKTGGLKRIKFRKGSSDRLVQKIVQEMFEKVNRVPNPPDSLLSKKGEFHFNINLVFY